jgi:hypothetical protein
MRTILALSLGAISLLAVSSLLGQSLPALPSGFQPDPQNAQLQAQIRATGASDGTGGTKANDNMSPCFSDPKIHFGYGWSLYPMGKTAIDMLLKAPQDPAKNSPMGFLDEPVSMHAYKGGAMEWRKQTWPVITGHPCKDRQVVFYNGKWTGYAGNKLIVIAVDNLYNSQGQGQAWIDEYIDKVTGALSSKSSK